MAICPYRCTATSWRVIVAICPQGMNKWYTSFELILVVESALSSPSPLPASSSWHGCLELVFDRSSEKTILSRSHAQSPLKIQRPFYPEGDAICHSVMLHTAGGVVGGDRISLKAALMPQSQALVTTAAAAKIYRSNGKEAYQDTQLTLGADTCLEWLPQDTIVFDGARYQQNLRVDLAPGAVWLGWDITRLGRSARGERFLSGRWRSHTEVWQGDRLLWLDPQQIEGGSELLNNLHGLGGCPVIGSFALVGLEVSRELVEQARELWTEDRRHEGRAQAGEVGVTRLMSGLLCRYRGHSSTEVRHWFIQVWHLLRRSCLQRSACLPRVWQL